MILHVRDEQTDALVRRLAARKGVSLTEAIREAVEQALAQEEDKVSLWDRTADLRDTVASYPLTGQVSDKRFFDALSGQDDD